MKQSPEKLTLKIEEAAKVLGVSKHTVYEAIRAGTLPTIRMGRRHMVPRHALLDLMGTPKPDRSHDRTYEEGVLDERARVTDLLIKLLADLRGIRPPTSSGRAMLQGRLPEYPATHWNKLLPTPPMLP